MPARGGKRTQPASPICSAKPPHARNSRDRHQIRNRVRRTNARETECMTKGDYDTWGSRRHFLQMFSGAAVALGSRRVLPVLAAESSAFEEISPAASGISWRHVSGRSAMAHL